MWYGSTNSLTHSLHYFLKVSFLCFKTSKSRKSKILVTRDIRNHVESFCSTTNETTNLSKKQSIYKTVKQPSEKSTNKSFEKSAKQSAEKSTKQSSDKSTKSTLQSTEKTLNDLPPKSINQPSNEPAIDKSTNQSARQSTCLSKAINESANQSTDYQLSKKMFDHFEKSLSQSSVDTSEYKTSFSQLSSGQPVNQVPSDQQVYQSPATNQPINQAPSFNLGKIKSKSVSNSFEYWTEAAKDDSKKDEDNVAEKCTVSELVHEPATAEADVTANKTTAVNSVTEQLVELKEYEFQNHKLIFSKA